MGKNIIIAMSMVGVGTLVFSFLIISIAKRIDLVDHPGGRKHHPNPTPLIGGIVMFIAFSFGSLGPIT